MIAEFTLILKGHAAIGGETLQCDSILEKRPEGDKVKKKGK